MTLRRGLVVLLACAAAGCAGMGRMAEDERGFKALFNGENLEGWTGDTSGYAAEDGVLVCRADGMLFTENEYSDFVLRFEFRLTPGANNGLAIRSPLEGNPAYHGVELQILDNTAARITDKLQPWKYHGSIYGVVPAKRGFLNRSGEWNRQEVIANRRQIKVILNGAIIVDADLDEVSAPDTMDGRPHPGLKRDSGHIGFIGHGSRVEFRNIRIKALP